MGRLGYSRAIGPMGVDAGWGEIAAASSRQLIVLGSRLRIGTHCIRTIPRSAMEAGRWGLDRNPRRGGMFFRHGSAFGAPVGRGAEVITTFQTETQSRAASWNQ